MSYYSTHGDTAGVRAALETMNAREAFVDRLADGPTWKRDLQEELGVSRSTVYKAIRDLTELGLVERREDGYELSLTGRLLFERRRRFHESADAIYRAAPLLSAVPSDVDVPAALLVGAEVVLCERFAPNRPIHRIETLVREANAVKGFSPVVLPQYVDVFHDELVSNGLRAELLLERPVVDHLVTEYGQQLAEAKEAGTLAVRRTEETLPYGMIRLGDPTRRVVLIAHGSEGDLRGLIINDAPPALEWAETEWERRVAAGEPFITADG